MNAFPLKSRAPSQGSEATFGNPNIADPVTPSARKASVNIFAFEVGGCKAQPRAVDVLEHVDVYNCIEMIVYFAGDQRNGAATCADMKGRCPGSERVL
jgi:hypothetical protein